MDLEIHLHHPGEAADLTRDDEGGQRMVYLVHPCARSDLELK